MITLKEYQERFVGFFDNTLQENDLFQMVENGLKIPYAKLYRYRPLSFFSASEIENQEVFLAPPNSFDDVFDSKFLWQNKLPYLKSLYELKLENLENEQIRKLNNYTNQNMRIACFSSNPRSIPMWYYYADRNRGLCIEYDMEAMPSFQENKYVLLPVVYPSPAEADYYRTPGINAKNKKIVALRNALIKNHEWEFEHEWRLIKFSEESETNYFQMKIKSIYVGWSMDNGTLRKVCQYVDILSDEVPINMMMPTINGLEPYPVDKSKFL